MENPIIFTAEIIGTIAFASSGAMLGIRKNLDLFGVLVLGLCVAVGGGIVRDIILGRTPPGAFRDPVYALVALGTSALLFLLVDGKQEIMTSRYLTIYEQVMNYCDAVGLGIFTVLGVYTAHGEGYDGIFFLVFLGMMTGIGGGLIRRTGVCAFDPYPSVSGAGSRNCGGDCDPGACDTLLLGSAAAAA